MTEWEKLLSLVPEGPDWKIDWEAWSASSCKSFFERMAETWQNPNWHGEGDVWTHTRMVCEELTSMESFRSLPKRLRQEIFLAALFHDIGKIPCTRLEDGCLVSPNHTAVGARMAREFFRVDLGLGGKMEEIRFREAVCQLIRYHSVPTHILDQADPERRIYKIAANGELTEDFTLELLRILAEADVRGRIYPRIEESVEMVRLFGELAEECACLRGPFSFPSPRAEYAYLSGRKVVPGQELYDDTWGEVVLLSGLPGTGKDTYLREYFPDLPMVSLDELRWEFGVSPTEPQGPVAAAARERAKEYLRKKQPFVWNATSLTPSLREKQVRLFQNYRASVRIVYLETSFEEQLQRNRNRAARVPEEILGKMQKNLVLPERFEAERVEWTAV